MSRAWKGGTTSTWRRLRLLVLGRDGYRCQVPQRNGQPCPRPATQVDHIVAKSLGGTDELTNLRAACAPCNASRGDGTRDQADGTRARPLPRRRRPSSPTSRAPRTWEW